MSNVTSFEVTGDWRHIVDDGMVDGDNLPDEVPLTGKVVFKPVYPTVATAGVPVTAYTLGPVTALVAGGVLTDLQGRPGVMLAGKVGEHTVRWSAETTLRFQEQKVDYPRVTFELTEDVRLTGIITQVGPSLSPIVVDPRIEALAASVESVNLAVVEAEGHASDAAEAVTLAGQEADRAIGLAGAQDEHIAGTLEDPTSATHAAFKAVGNATYLPLAGNSEPIEIAPRSFPDPGGDNGVQTEDVTSRITLQSYQTAHGGDRTGKVSGAGEVVRIQLMDPVAKGMFAWQLPYDPEQPYDPDTNWMRTVVWEGAHWDSPPRGTHPIHGHWSVEVPDAQGDLRTRFAVQFVNTATGAIGVDRAVIRTDASDFVVGCGDGFNQPVPMFRIAGSNNVNKTMQFSVDPVGNPNPARTRWELSMDNSTESGGDAGSNFRVRNFGDDGTYLGVPFYMERARGRIGIGMGAAPVLQDAQLTARWDSGKVGSGLFLAPSAALSGANAGIYAIMGSAADTLIRALAQGDTSSRFTMQTTGALAWGSGSSLADVTLSRQSSGVLQTGGQFQTGGSLRVNTTSTGGGQGVIALANAATAPTTNPSGGGVMYSEGGALKWRGPSGTITTIAPA